MTTVSSQDHSQRNHGTTRNSELWKDDRSSVGRKMTSQSRRPRLSDGSKKDNSDCFRHEKNENKRRDIELQKQKPCSGSEKDRLQDEQEPAALPEQDALVPSIKLHMSSSLVRCGCRLVNYALVAARP